MHTSFPLFPDRSQVQSLFKTLLIKSVIQLELIHAIDNIIFYPTSSRNDDERNMAAVKVSMAKRTERCCILTRSLLKPPTSLYLHVHFKMPFHANVSIPTHLGIKVHVWLHRSFVHTSQWSQLFQMFRCLYRHLNQCH